jgi:hypothetical protein
LLFTGSLSAWNEARPWNRFLSPLYAIDWNVYSKPPAAGPEVVLKYLARYTHRVAISNPRIERIADGQVTFRYQDYAQRGRTRRLTLSAAEFLSRFVRHVLPKGFVRIRSFGILANRRRGDRLDRCRELLDAPIAQELPSADSSFPDGEDELRCPLCRRGRLQLTAEIARPRVADLVARTYGPDWLDTS